MPRLGAAGMNDQDQRNYNAKEQLLLPLLTNHSKQEETVIDGQGGKGTGRRRLMFFCFTTSTLNYMCWYTKWSGFQPQRKFCDHSYGAAAQKQAFAQIILACVHNQYCLLILSYSEILLFQNPLFKGINRKRSSLVSGQFPFLKQSTRNRHRLSVQQKLPETD